MIFSDPQEEETPYSFFVNETEVTSTLGAALDASASEEQVLTILYQPQAVFKVRAVSRWGFLEASV